MGRDHKEEVGRGGQGKRAMRMSERKSWRPRRGTETLLSGHWTSGRSSEPWS
jgi:hypothetical protein